MSIWRKATSNVDVLRAMGAWWGVHSSSRVLLVPDPLEHPRSVRLPAHTWTAFKDRRDICHAMSEMMRWNADNQPSDMIHRRQ